MENKVIGRRSCRCGKPAIYLMEKTGRWVCDPNIMNCEWWKRAMSKGKKDARKLRPEVETKIEL